MKGSGWSKAKADIVLGIALLAAASLMFAHTFANRYDSGPLFGDVSTVFVPRIVLVLIGCLAVIMAIRGAMTRDSEQLEELNWRRMAITFGAACATSLGIWVFGYVLAMPVGIFLVGLAIGYPNKLVLAATCVVATAVIWVALGYFARVPLPTGTIY